MPQCEHTREPAPQFDVDAVIDETIRVLQACQFVRANGEVCPADWRPGDDTIKPNANDALTYFARQHAAA